jgi:hypothetical protein
MRPDSFDTPPSAAPFGDPGSNPDDRPLLPQDGESSVSPYFAPVRRSAGPGRSWTGSSPISRGSSQISEATDDQEQPDQEHERLDRERRRARTSKGRATPTRLTARADPASAGVGAQP